MTGDSARVSVAVAVPPDEAFEIFTGQIDLWWRSGVKFRHAGSRSGIVHIEAGIGGRLFESFEGDSGSHVIEIGRVEVWDPPSRLGFSWRNANYDPGEYTAVEIEFAPTQSGTLVTVTHRGLAAQRADHPARHGLLGAQFSRLIGLWWGEQMTSLRRLSAGRPS